MGIDSESELCSVAGKGTGRGCGCRLLGLSETLAWVECIDIPNVPGSLAGTSCAGSGDGWRLASEVLGINSALSDAAGSVTIGSEGMKGTLVFVSTCISERSG